MTSNMSDLGNTTPADLPEPRSVEEIASIALAVERAAERRYSASARDLRAFGSPELAALLEELGGEHGARAGRLEADLAIGDGQEIASKDLAPLLPQLFSQDATAACDLFGLTSYGVLAFAVGLAQQTFTLYSYLAAAADPSTRDYAERLAGEELSRAVRLRIARRRAYHAERRQPKTETYPVAGLVESRPDLLAAALAIESRLALRLAMAGEKQAGFSSTCEATRQRVEELRRASAQAGEASGSMAEELAGFARSAQRIGPADQDRAAATRRLLADCERAFTFYDAVASAPVNEAVMLHAQDLSQAAVERLRQVRAAADGPDETDRVDDGQ
jgi:rubrerythrin